ncbi:uncharacterized protein LOC143845355 isoform X2 [Tasmannia lanceolata]|uniref:uncharacterized protein LOC143845355 isoform X2 n=1 Tax=Tasmannia lanceolata TaxID=3420 RepID=UPI0040634313
MADDLEFASRADNKRKYEEQMAPPPRRATGFSAPIVSQDPPSSYNNVPPPSDEIQLAKQRAQEIAARLFSNAEAKRPRSENGDDSNGKGFGSGPIDIGQKPPGPPASIPVAYGFQGATKKMDIPNGRVGVIIGKGGETIKYLQLQSGAKIQVTRDMDADPTSQTRPVELVGTPEQISKAEQLINDVLSEAEAGGSGTAGSRRFTSGQTGAEQFTMKVPTNKVGLIIGKGGETIKNMQARSGARIQLIPLHPPPGDTSTERTVQIEGTKEQIESAKQLVEEVTSENRARNPHMGGGYSQQGGYRPPRPPTNWGPPGPPMQQPGYGYMQPGAYPGQPPQYNMSQPPYNTGYPPQPASGGWDQTTAPANQQTPQSAGYDYYGQQQQPTAPGGSSAPTDNSTYNYGQPPASNYNPQGGSYGESTYSQPPVGQQQGYTQDAYGGAYSAPVPQSGGYSQPQSNPPPGYEYGTVVNPTQDGSATYGAQGGATQVPSAQQVGPPVQPPATNQQGYAGQQPTSTPTSYTSQATTQPGYGIPPTSQPGYGSQPPAQTIYAQSAPVTQPGYGPPQGQKPPPTQGVYGQTQQAPTTQGGYSHSQLPQTQSGYAQQVAHPGYGQQQSYGAPPPAAQPGYAQQQPYNDSYGGGYAQPTVYSTDTAAGAQTIQSGIPKASPSS